MKPASSQGLEQDGTSGSRTKSVLRRELADRLNAAARRSGFTLESWQVRQLVRALASRAVELTDEQILLALMRAPWYPKPRHRQWRVGEGGGWATRS